MTKVDVVRAEMVKAMKAGDKERKNALSMLLSALKNASSVLQFMRNLYRR